MLTLDEVKKYLRVDSSDEDSLITSLISTADSLVRDVSRLGSDDKISEASKPVMMAAELFLHMKDFVSMYLGSWQTTSTPKKGVSRPTGK